MRRRFGCGTARPRASDVRARRTLLRPRPSRTRVGGPIVAETGGFRFDWRRRRFRLPRGGVFRGVGPPVPGWRAARGPTALSWPCLGRRGECSRQDSTCAHSSGGRFGPRKLRWSGQRPGLVERGLSTDSPRRPDHRMQVVDTLVPLGGSRPLVPSVVDVRPGCQPPISLGLSIPLRRSHDIRWLGVITPGEEGHGSRWQGLSAESSCEEVDALLGDTHHPCHLCQFFLRGAIGIYRCSYLL